MLWFLGFRFSLSAPKRAVEISMEKNTLLLIFCLMMAADIIAKVDEEEEFLVKDYEGQEVSEAQKKQTQRHPTSIESVLGQMPAEQRQEIQKTLENYKKAQEKNQKILNDLENED